MHLKSLFTKFARLAKPDKALAKNFGDDLRKIGIIFIGAGTVGGSIQSGGLAIGLFVTGLGVIIWAIGLHFSSAPDVEPKPKEEHLS